MKIYQKKAFTYIELMIALAVVSIALLGLIKLNLVNINLTNEGKIYSRATLIGQEKIAELLAAGYPPIGANWGVQESGPNQYKWRMEVRDVQVPISSNKNPARLREVVVTVACQNASRIRYIELKTLAADNNIHESTIE